MKGLRPLILSVVSTGLLSLAVATLVFMAARRSDTAYTYVSSEHATGDEVATIPGEAGQTLDVVVCTPTTSEDNEKTRAEGADPSKRDPADWGVRITKVGAEVEPYVFSANDEAGTLLVGELTCGSIVPVVLDDENELLVQVGTESSEVRVLAVRSDPSTWLEKLCLLLLLLSMCLRALSWAEVKVEADTSSWRRYDPALGVVLIFMGLLLVGAVSDSSLSQALSFVDADAKEQLANYGLTMFGVTGIFGGLLTVGVYLCASYGLGRLRSDAPGVLLGTVVPKRLGLLKPAAMGLGLAIVAMLILVGMPPEKASPMQWVTSVPIGVMVLGATALIAPWFEELFFRGFIYGGVESALGKWPAVVTSAALFTLAHVPQHVGFFVPLIPIALVGIATSWLRAHTGSTTSAFALHLAYNTTLVLPSVLAI